ncbi:hypothetical protein DRN44_03050, partial [Thermococci archaeon]
MINWFRDNPHPNTVWDIMNPTFTYNLINDGQVSDPDGDGRVEDHGSYSVDAMNLISTVGAVPYGAFPVYNGLNYGLWNETWNSTIWDWYWNNYTAYNNWLEYVVSVWPEEVHWREAMLNRGKGDMYSYSTLEARFWSPGYVYIIDMTDDTQFQYLKGLLAAGYVAHTSIYTYDEFHHFNSTNNIYALNQQHTGDRGGHSVTIVGYDDNKDTPDGKGAFLMVNSWGADWGDHGYWWLTYQAAQDPNHKLSYGYAYILVPKEPQPYKPKLYASFKVTHPKRGEIIGGYYGSNCPEGYICYPPEISAGIELGAGDENSPFWNQMYFNFLIGYQHSLSDLANYQAHPFPDSPIVLDLTDSLDALTTSTAVNSQYVPFYIKLADKYGDGVTGTLDSFKVIINSTYMQNVIEASTSFPVSIPEDRDWLTVYAWVPVVDYVESTPLDNQKLTTDWAYIEVGSIVNMSSAVLHFNGQDYTMNVDNPYHLYYNVSGLSEGAYTYNVTVTLQNGNLITLPQRTVHIIISEGVLTINTDRNEYYPDGFMKVVGQLDNLTENDAIALDFAWIGGSYSATADLVNGAYEYYFDLSMLSGYSGDLIITATYESGGDVIATATKTVTIVDTPTIENVAVPTEPVKAGTIFNITADTNLGINSTVTLEIVKADNATNIKVDELIKVSEGGAFIYTVNTTDWTAGYYNVTLSKDDVKKVEKQFYVYVVGPNVTLKNATFGVPEETVVPFTVPVNVTLENTGDLDGNHTVEVYLDDEVANSTTVTVEAGKEKSVILNVEITEAGEHVIKVNGFNVTVNATEKLYVTIDEYDDRVQAAENVYITFKDYTSMDYAVSVPYITPTLSGVAPKFKFAENLVSELGNLTANDVVISIGGPLVNDVTAYYEDIAPVHMVVGENITIVTLEGNFTW